MANKVEIVVVARDDTGAVFDNIQRKAEQAGQNAGKAAGDGISKGIEDAVDGDGIGEKIGDEVGDGIKTGVEKGVADIAPTATSAGQAAGEAVKHGIEDGLKDMEGAGKNSGDSFSRGFSGAISNGIKDVGNSLLTGLSSVIEAGGIVKDALVAALIAGAVIASPLIVSAIAGVISAAGLITAAVSGVILAGLADPTIVAEAKNLGTNILNALKIDATPFIEPVHAAIASLQQDFIELQPTLQNLFANSAQYVQPLTDAISGLVSSVVEGIDAMVAGAGPETMASITAGFQSVGDALFELFTTIGENGPAIADALTVAFELLATAIGAISAAITVAAPLFETFVDGLRKIHELVDPQEGQFVEYNGALTDMSAGLQGVAGDAQAAAQALQNLMTTQLALYNPVLQYSNALVDVANKQSAYNKAVDKYGESSTQAQGAAISLGNAVLLAAAAAAKTGDDLSNGLTPAMRATMEAMKLSKPTIDAVDQALKNTTASANAVPKQVKINLSQEGAEGAITKFDETKNALAAIPSSKTITINVVETGAGVAALRRSGGAFGSSHAATGGNRGGMVLVGEEGPELVRLPYGSTVVPHGQTTRMVTATGQSQKPQAPAMNDHMQEMLYELRMVRKALAKRGDVFLDNRLVGAVQGRQADIYDRAG